MRSLTPELVRCLSTILDTRTDSEVLTGFLANHTPGDFAELVRRYGPMVWGTCRRVLPDYADAEDAFQTVFMVLVQRGNRLKDSATIGPWLHRVALWTTRNLRRRNARRMASRIPLPEQLAASARDVDLSLDLDAALLSLPEKFRSSILLCHVIGLTRAEAAAQLGCAERTLSFWLARGLAQLRHKLRGLDPTKTLTLAALAVPVGLSESVVRAAMSLRAAGIAASVLSSTVTQLAEGVLRMFWIKKATAATMSLFAIFALGVGIGVSTRQLSPASGGDEKGEVQDSQGKLDPKTVPILPTDPKSKKTQKELKEILEKQEVQIEGNVNEMTLMELLKILSKKHDIAFVIMVDHFKAEKIADIQDKKPVLTTTKVNVIKLGVFLDLVLTSMNATFIVRPDYIEITTFDRRLQEKAARVFPLDDAVNIDLEEVKKHLAKAQASLAILQKQFEQSLSQSIQIESEFKARKAEVQALERSIEAASKALHKNDAANAPAAQGILQLTIKAEAAVWPYQVKEFGPDGKLIGEMAFDSVDTFGRYLIRTVKDARGPNEIRILSHPDTPEKVLKTVILYCGVSEFKYVFINEEDRNPPGYVKTLNKIIAEERKKTGEEQVLAGTWVCQSSEVNGIKRDAKASKDQTITFGGKKCTIKDAATGEVIESTYELDLSGKLWVMTTKLKQKVNGKELIIQYIFKRDGDTLEMCSNLLPGQALPTEFSAPEGSKRLYSVFKREKK